MPTRTVVIVTGFIALFALTLPSSALARDLYLEHSVSQWIDDEWVPAGFGCSWVPKRSESSAASEETLASVGGDDEIFVADDFQLVEEVDRGIARVKIYSEGTLVDERVYNRKFLRSDRIDRFVIRTDGGRAFALEYWGADDCEPD
jgi:hypothetical protein